MSPVPIAPTAKNHPTTTADKWARMRYLLLMLFTFHFSLLIFNSCGLDIEDPTPPSAPVWVQKSLPGIWPERGIDAHESGGIYLEWEANPDEDIVAYNIYRATYFNVNDSMGSYELIARLETSPSAELCYLDEELQIRTKYSYKIKSQDEGDNFSDYSDSLSYTLLPQINFSRMSPNGLLDTLDVARHLSWHYGYNIEMENYYISILAGENKIVARESLLPGNYIDGHETWQIPTEIPLISDQLYWWRIDTGARYMEGSETAGSESQWAAFVYGGE